MTTFGPLRRCWRSHGMVPAFSDAADDVAALRAELQALKNDYAARVGALETRIEQLGSIPVGTATEPPAPLSCQMRWEAVRVAHRHSIRPSP